jgi:hypothetical protein
MPSYDVKCPVHGDGVTVGSMKSALAGELMCFAEQCCERVTRIFPRGTYANDLSENTFKPYFCENLTKGHEPVYIANRAEENRRMSAMGLMRWEPGMGREKNISWSSKDRE